MPPDFNNLLLILYILVATLGSIFLTKKDPIVGAYFFSLFVYTVFAQIGYLYYPELSQTINAYYGEEKFVVFNLFIAMSTLCVFCILYWRISRVGFLHYRFQVLCKPSVLSFTLFYFLSLLFLFLLSYVFIKDFNSLSYQSLPSGDFRVFTILFKINSIFVVALYAVLRFYAKRNINILVLLVFLWSLSLAVLGVLKVGSRTDLMSILLGILFYELYFSFVRKELVKTLTKAFIFIVPIVIFALYIEQSRVDELPKVGVENLLKKDYFAPSHVLFTAIYYEYINPIKVVVSNLANSLILLNEPYLQEELSNIMRPNSSDRSRSFALHPFTEGYIFMGLMGWIYNGIVLPVLFLVWRWFSRSSNLYFNAFIYGLIGSQLLNLSRGQSSYYIKYAYILFLVPVVLYILATGVNFFKRNYKE